MLFHITAIHSENNCAANNNKNKELLVEGNTSKEILEKKYNVKFLNGGYDMGRHQCYFRGYRQRS